MIKHNLTKDSKRRLYTKKCLRCDKEFHPFNHAQVFCSNGCSALWKTRHSRYKKICRQCKKEFITRKRRNQFFCSRACYLLSKTKNSKILICCVCKKQFKAKACDIKRNKKYCSRKCMGIAFSKQYSGNNNPSYVDGKNAERAKERDAYRATIEYKNFIRGVFIRDKNKCQDCGLLRKRIKDGKGKNNNFTVHHIKPWKTHPKLRFKVSNGIVLCQPCHMKRHHKKYNEAIKW